MERKRNWDSSLMPAYGDPKTLLVGDEKQEDFDALIAWWKAQYGAEYAARPLVEEAALNEWLLKRAQRNQLAVEAELHGTDAAGWTEAQFRFLQQRQRFKAAAERSFHRSVAALERARRTRVSQALRATEGERARQQPTSKVAQPSKGERFSALPPAVPVPAESQWITVEVRDGKTSTEIFPSNQEVLERIETEQPRPVRVFRNFDFVYGVPPEYAWAARGAPGGKPLRMQAMRLGEWKRALEREKTLDGHVGPVEQDESWLRRWAIYADADTEDQEERYEEARRPASDPGAMGGDSDSGRENCDTVDPGECPAG